MASALGWPVWSRNASIVESSVLPSWGTKAQPLHARAVDQQIVGDDQRVRVEAALESVAAAKLEDAVRVELGGRRQARFGLEVGDDVGGGARSTAAAR